MQSKPAGARDAASHFVPAMASTAIYSGLPIPHGPAILSAWAPSHPRLFTVRSVRAAAGRATEARKEADRLAVEAWNKRMFGFQGPAQPSPTLGHALNAGLWLSGSEMPWLQDAPDSCPRHRAATEDNADP